jgi:hypothetical protein
MTLQDEHENPVTEVVHEAAVSWRDTPAWGRAAMATGGVAFLLLSFLALPAAPHGLYPLLRTLALAVLVSGAVANARGADIFYRQIYLEGSAFAVVISTVLLYAAAEFRIDLAQNAVTVLLAALLAGVGISFLRLRRA